LICAGVTTCNSRTDIRIGYLYQELGNEKAKCFLRAGVKGVGAVNGAHGNYLLLRNVVTYAENEMPNMGQGEFKFIRVKSRLVSLSV
jgi:hypothetical protein